MEGGKFMNPDEIGQFAEFLEHIATETQQLIFSVLNIIETDEPGRTKLIDTVFSDLSDEALSRKDLEKRLPVQAVEAAREPNILVILMRDGTWYLIYRNPAYSPGGTAAKYNVRLFGLADEAHAGFIGRQSYSLNIVN